MERSLLVLLALDVGHVVSTDRLLEDLWEGEPPESQLGALRTLVSRLRKTLARAGASDVVRTQAPGYVLSAEVAVDTSAFSSLVAEGTALLGDGASAQASETLGRALSLWRSTQPGPFPGETGRVEATRLEQLRLRALEARIEADLACGRHRELLGELQALTTTYPLHERFWAARITSLYRSGRQAEALRTYEELRQLLLDEMGIDPGPELRQLEAAVLAQEPSLMGAAPAPVAPAVAQAVPGSDGGPDGGRLARGAALRVPLPARLTQPPAVGVIGRHGELSRLNDAYKRVASGEGREIVLVSGEAGAGKSTLAAAFARAVDEAGACVLFGHCDEDLGAPYQAFREALHHYVVHAPTGDLEGHVRTSGGELARLVPVLGQHLSAVPPPQPSDPDTERYLLFGAVLDLFTRASVRQPVVLVLDDLQWADQPTLKLLGHVVASADPLRLLVVATYRDARLTGSHPLTDMLAALRREQGVTRIDLRGLDDLGVVAFIEATAGHRLDLVGLDLAHAVYRETDGNPFFVGEVLRHLAETGAITRDVDGRWMAKDASSPLSLPDSVREVIAARVGRLSAGAERVLSVAAVIGRDFDLDLLVGATDTPADELLEVLEAAQTAALVRELDDGPGRYTFAHAIVQHTLVESLGPTRLARVHRAVAEALEELCGGRPGARVSELAYHWVRATQPAELTRAIGYSRQAAEAALAELAPDDAVRHFTQALELYAQCVDPDPVLGIDLHIGLGVAQRQTGEPAYRATLLGASRRAADLGDTERLVSAALANDRGFFSLFGNTDADKLAVLELALGRLSADHPHRALVVANLCKELSLGSPFARRQALAEEAVALAVASGDDATIVAVLNRVAVPLLVPSLLEQSLTRSADALARAERLGDPALLFWSATLRGMAVACAMDVDELDRTYEISDAVAARVHQPTLNWVQTLRGATRALMSGDVAAAEQLAFNALRIGSDSGEPDAGSILGAQVIGVSFERGTLPHLVPVIEQQVAENPLVPAFAAALALAHAEAGQLDPARLLLEAFADGGYAFPSDFIWFTGMTLYAEVAAELRDPTFAGPLYEQLAPWADRLAYDAVTCAGPVAHYAGALAAVLGRYDEAEDLFTRSAAFSERVGAKFYAARTALSWGRMLAERAGLGDAERAAELLAAARSDAGRHGFAVVEARAADALRRLA